MQRDGRVSVNMKPSALENFLESGCWLNMFEVAEIEARKTGRELEVVLREKLGHWYEWRIEFERSAGEGVHFHYGH